MTCNNPNLDLVNINRTSDFCCFYLLISCVDPESFVRRGPTLTTFFLVDEAFRWRADDGPRLNPGMVAL